MDRLTDFNNLPREVYAEDTPVILPKNDWVEKVESTVDNSVNTFLDTARRTGNIFKGFDAVLDNGPGKLFEGLLFIQNSVNNEKGVDPMDKPTFLELCKAQLLSDPIVSKALDSQGTITGSVIKGIIQKFSL